MTGRVSKKLKNKTRMENVNTGGIWAKGIYRNFLYDSCIFSASLQFCQNKKLKMLLYKNQTFHKSKIKDENYSTT